MSTAAQRNLISVEDYLAGELASPVKHEYLGGVVYAMAGARNAHNKIVGNIFGSLWGRLRDQPCQPFNSDTKVRVPLPGHVRFYYPDVRVHAQFAWELGRRGLVTFLRRFTENQYRYSLGLQLENGHWYAFPYPPAFYILCWPLVRAGFRPEVALLVPEVHGRLP